MTASPGHGPDERFLAAVSRPDDRDIPLAEAALLAAHALRPPGDPAAHLARLDALADTLKLRLAAPAVQDWTRPADVRRAAVALADLLHRETGLAGNAAHYYDPLNSHLDRVLERGLGIPITLSIITLEVARRAGLAAVGIGFPGHFLVGLGPDAARLLIDPFHGGRIVGRAELEERVRQQFGPDAALDPAWLRPVTHREILVRLLNNLKAIHAREGTAAQSLTVAELLVCLLPFQWDLRRDRGLLRRGQGLLAPALADLETYLKACPEAEDAPVVRRALNQVRRDLARLN